MFTRVDPPAFRYPAPVLRTAPSGATWYETHDGKRAQRASKVVNEPFDPVAWYDMCGGQSDGATVSSIINGIGTLTHRRIELYLRNEPAPKWNLPYVNQYFGGIQPLLDNITNVMCNEQAVYSPTLGIAGTIDCIADYKGVTSIIDFKTSTKPKKESDILSYFLQTTLYSRIFEEMTGVKIDRVAILMTVSGGQYKEFLKDTADYDTKLDTVLQKFQEEQN